MRIEPSSDMRQGAAMLYQFYIALIHAGFSEDQAFELVKAQLQSASSSGTGGGSGE